MLKVCVVDFLKLFIIVVYELLVISYRYQTGSVLFYLWRFNGSPCCCCRLRYLKSISVVIVSFISTSGKRAFSPRQRPIDGHTNFNLKSFLFLYVPTYSKFIGLLNNYTSCPLSETTVYCILTRIDTL